MNTMSLSTHFCGGILWIQILTLFGPLPNDGSSLLHNCQSSKPLHRNRTTATWAFSLEQKRSMCFLGASGSTIEMVLIELQRVIFNSARLEQTNIYRQYICLSYFIIIFLQASLSTYTYFFYSTKTKRERCLINLQTMPTDGKRGGQSLT